MEIGWLTIYSPPPTRFLVIDHYGIQLGPLYIRFYGIILMTGALAGAWLASREAQRRGRDPQHIWDALMWVLIPGVIGARLYHVLTPSPSMGITPLWYLQNPLEILAIWKGGLGIYGALAGGSLGLWLYTQRNKLDFWAWLDIAAPGLALAQAIGRWGNFVNQELYGAPTSVP
jgi:phosphatidylglycerol:prolipoprotein diacylglycerol transferase